MKKLKVGLIFGGRSGEHEVSLLSARAVLNALNRDKYEVTEIGITHDGTWLIGENILDAFVQGKMEPLIPVTLLPDPTRRGLFAIQTLPDGEILVPSQQFDVFFPIVHGTFGEDGTLQGLLELANVAYVGPGVLGAAVGMDKGVFKAVMQAYDIPVAAGVMLSRTEIDTDMDAALDRVEAELPYPLFVKPANMGSSVGVSKCQSRADLLEGLLEAGRFDRRILVEQGINAREIEISVLGNDQPEASVPGEIRPVTEFYSYDAKYHDDRSEAFIPADIPAETAAAMQAIAIKAYLAIDCAGLARVDFLLDKENGEFYLNELNTIPGFTEISMYPKLWEASGLSFPNLVDRLIALALERRAERDNIEWRFER
ncbi:MAG: D-alanine--D-alanine ligase [Chloroflexi bacterium]|nr:D-alanine--D-alanine ligase [Chloroflexota bacterium]